ncbi:MAG: virulence RhuM family protein, partial [Bacteroidales bacterium]|nr:virulence RhuM family protein [Bacteroidales bacterium]
MLDNQNPQKGEVVLYQPNETIRIEVRMENETVWLTQAQMAELFNKDQSVIARHIKNIFDEQEVYEESNMQILHNTLSKFKPTKVYSLDVIISVGYRVKSQRGTLFRQWATNVIKEHLKRSWSNNTKRIENVENRLSTVESKIDFFVRTSLPPVEGVFSDG